MSSTLIISIALGYWERASGLMPLNPFPYAVTVLTADIAVLAGLVIFLWKRRTRMIVYPSPTMIAKITFSIQMPTLAIAILGIGPDLLLAVLMYLSIIFTLIAAYSYLKKGSYVFTQ
jgi:phosphatidylglycerophosphate synthase